MTVRAILFDLFDTLVDLYMDRLPAVEINGRKFRSTHRELHNVLVRRLDIDFESFGRALFAVDSGLRAETYERGRELPTQRRFTALLESLGVPDGGLASELTETHMQGLYEQTEFLPHHTEILSELAAERALGVCSNFSHSATAERILVDAGLHEHFSAVTISDQVGIRKPRPEIFRAALAALAVTPEEAIHVGDNLDADVAGADAVGIRTVWIHRRVPDPGAALRSHGGPRPTWQIADLAELPELLRDLPAAKHSVS